MTSAQEPERRIPDPNEVGRGHSIACDSPKTLDFFGLIRGRLVNDNARRGDTSPCLVLAENIADEASRLLREELRPKEFDPVADAPMVDAYDARVDGTWRCCPLNFSGQSIGLTGLAVNQEDSPEVPRILTEPIQLP